MPVDDEAYLVPVFFVFPVAFTLNRLGQHYSIDPADPAGWSTLMRGHWFWDAAFLNSNYHLEHHYFPGVPFYHLPALQRAIALNKPVVLDVYMKNEPVPTAGHWNIMDIYSPGKDVSHVSTE